MSGIDSSTPASEITRDYYCSQCGSDTSPDEVAALRAERDLIAGVCGDLGTEVHDLHDEVAALRAENMMLRKQGDALHEKAMAVVAQERPSHEHYDDPMECALCRLFAFLDIADEREQMAALVDRWNADHPVGTPVCYWPGLRKGDGVWSNTRTPASLLGGYTPVVWVEGRGDCIALTHVEVRRVAG